MAEVIGACKGCRLLAVEDVPISGSAQAMPAVMRRLLERYGRVWTHALAINDIYFDYAAAELTRAGKPDGIHMLSAGDGSAAAFLRIQAGAFQTSTVAEPLNLQGWQLVDEVNRLLTHHVVTGMCPRAPCDGQERRFRWRTTRAIRPGQRLPGRVSPDMGPLNVQRSPCYPLCAHAAVRSVAQIARASIHVGRRHAGAADLSRRHHGGLCAAHLGGSHPQARQRAAHAIARGAGTRSAHVVD